MKRYENVRFLSDGKEEIHSHNEIELLYILAGEIQVNIQGQLYIATERNLAIINSEVLHGWNIEQEALMCRVQIDYYQLKQILNQEHVYIKCNSMENKGADYRKIRYILDCIVRNSADIANELVVQSLYYMLWECVKNQFIVPKDMSVIRSEKEAQVDAVIQDIRMRYAEELSLRSLSERWYVSESVLSRMVKKATGMKFVDFVRRVRLEHAREELLYSEKTITEIAHDCGFSNPSVFHKNFKEFYQLTPSAYRTSHLVSKDSKVHDNIAGKLNQYLSANSEKQKQKLNKSKRVIADCEVYKEAPNDAMMCVNGGMAMDLLEQRVQSQIADMVRSLQVRYIRISNLFDWNLNIRSGHYTEQMNFDKLDAIFDFFMEIDVLPILELPEKLRKKVIAVKEHGVSEAEKGKPIINSVEEWSTLFTAFLEHLIERYTRQTVSRWIFEIAYDIEHSTGAGKLPFKEVYLTTYRCIKAILPDAKICASELNVEMDAVTLKEQLLWWKEIEERPQFLSIMCYPYQVEATDCAEHPHLLDIESDTHFVQKAIRSYKALLEEIEYPQTPLWITEWNTSISERNYYNDSCAKACHMLTQMTDGADEVQMMNYNIVSDWHASFYDAKMPITGGTGLVTKDGLRKPAYYALEFWSSLGNRIMRKGDNYIITTREDGTIVILAFHGQLFNESYKIKEENEIMAQDLPYMFQENEPLHLSLHIKHVRDGKRKINKCRVRELEGNLLAEWEKMGYVETLNRSEITYLEKICIPRMENSWVHVEKETLNLELTVEKQEMQLILIY